jgi:hypothetical protein
LVKQQPWPASCFLPARKNVVGPQEEHAVAHGDPEKERKEGPMELEAILRRVRAEFVEMPGLRLTPAQATRLWGLEGDACHTVINALVASSFLRWTATGAVTRADEG